MRQPLQELSTDRVFLSRAMAPAMAVDSPCQACPARRNCLFARCNAFASGESAPVVRRIQTGRAVFFSGDEFRSIFMVRYGHLKKVQHGIEGAEQVTALSMAGDMLGGSGFANMTYGDSALALEDSELCEIPIRLLHRQFASSPELLRAFHSQLSGEIVEEQFMMQLLATMRAEQKMASYLVRLSERYRERGYSGSRFHLRMTRTDIASHLGLTIESISRLFTSFRKQGLIRVEGREVELIEPKRLRDLAAQISMAA